MNMTEQLLSDIDRFLEATEMSATRFGLQAAGDGKIIAKLQSGKTITLKKADQIRAYIAEYARSVQEHARAVQSAAE